MTTLLPAYILRKFTGLFLLCVLSVIVLFLVIDGIENMDKFIDRDVPFGVTFKYYLYYIPYILVLTLPVATLLAAVFAVVGLARGNEIVAMKSLGFSLYQLLIPMLGAGMVISMISFFTAEVIVARTTEKKDAIEQEYLRGGSSTKFLSRFRNMQIKDEDTIITIGYFDIKRRLAHRVRIQEIVDGRLAYRLDADSMSWENGGWIIRRGIERTFNDSTEVAADLASPAVFRFHFNPEELIQAQGSPEDMGYWELKKYVDRIRRSGGETSQWLTELHLRISYPLSNLLIILFSVPLVYNRRKKNIALGFGISLTVVFFYFGLVKMGQTLGQNGNLPPLLGAWMGNMIMCTGSVINLLKTRK
ncbi:LptF/LptG family permease [bacterium]|nr:LptF/LptG family permease [bacterium]